MTDRHIHPGRGKKEERMPEVHASESRNTSADDARIYVAICGLYLCIYYGLGALTPLISQYYESIRLTGTQIGIISSITPVVSIMTQPLWGMICDRYQMRKQVLILALLVAALVSLLFTQVSAYAWVVFLFTIVSVFQSAVIPVSDSLALAYGRMRNVPFGNLRLWGAVGFAAAVPITGLAVEAWGPGALFYFYAVASGAAILFLRKVPDMTEGTQFNAGIFQGLGVLVKLPRFVLFLIGAFFIFGSVNANNIYFSLLYQHVGGSVAGIGLAFLLFAGSEAPCMRAASYVIRRWGLESTILLAGCVSALRWFWYSTAPSTAMILAFFLIQGVSVGFYLATAAQYVRENTPAALQVTALAVFLSFGQGLGTMACNLFGGIIMQYFGILNTYLFFGITTTAGLIPILLICFGPWKRRLSA
jgi:PPP family 3-phenylpropionic acid transporter